MGRQRKTWSVEEKMAIVLSMLRDEQNVAQLARQHGVNESQLYCWKTQFLGCGRRGLSGSKAASGEQRLKAENEQLKKLLGKKALEVDILKKKEKECSQIVSWPPAWRHHPTIGATERRNGPNLGKRVERHYTK